MKKTELKLETGDYYVNGDLELVKEHDPEICTDEDDSKQAFILGCEGWEGVNGFKTEDYEEDLKAINNELHKHILDLYVTQVPDLIDDGDVVIKSSTGRKIHSIAKSAYWVTKQMYEFYKNTESSKTRTPAMTLLCESSVDELQVLILANCNITKKGA
jgi:hypothetical protein